LKILGISKSFTPAEMLNLILFYGTLVSFYFIFYHLIRDNSPTLMIIRKLYESVDQGVPEQKLAKLFNDKDQILDRLDYLLEKNMVEMNNNVYFLTKKGSAFLAKAMLIRQFMKLDQKIG
jgi:hypothetical protein